MENHTCISLRAMADGNKIFPGEINLPNSLTIMQKIKLSVVCNKLGVPPHLVRLLFKSYQDLGYVFKSTNTWGFFYLKVIYVCKNMKIILN